MKLKPLIRFLIPVLTVISLAACSSGTTTPIVDFTPAAASPSAESTALPETATGTPAASTGSGACSNPLYPVVNGATWTYAVTGSSGGNYSFTDTITDVRADGFTVTTVIDSSVTTTQQWACKPEGLAALQLPGFVTILAMRQLNASLQTSNVQGVVLPPAVNPGDEWDLSMDLQGSLETDGIQAQTQGKALYHFKAAGIESVTVPAGTYDAMRIDGVLTFDSTASVSGFSIPVKITLNTSTWYATGVGMVRNQTTGDLVGTAINDTLELQTYNIP